MVLRAPDESRVLALQRDKRRAVAPEGRREPREVWITRSRYQCELVHCMHWNAFYRATAKLELKGPVQVYMRYR